MGITDLPLIWRLDPSIILRLPTIIKYVAFLILLPVAFNQILIGLAAYVILFYFQGWMPFILGKPMDFLLFYLMFVSFIIKPDMVKRIRKNLLTTVIILFGLWGTISAATLSFSPSSSAF